MNANIFVRRTISVMRNRDIYNLFKVVFDFGWASIIIDLNIEASNMKMLWGAY